MITYQREHRNLSFVSDPTSARSHSAGTGQNRGNDLPYRPDSNQFGAPSGGLAQVLNSDGEESSRGYGPAGASSVPNVAEGPSKNPAQGNDETSNPTRAPASIDSPSGGAQRAPALVNAPAPSSSGTQTATTADEHDPTANRPRPINSPLPPDPANDSIDQRIARLNDQINAYEQELQRSSTSQSNGPGNTSSDRSALHNELRNLQRQKRQLTRRLRRTGRDSINNLPPFPRTTFNPNAQVASDEPSGETGNSTSGLESGRTLDDFDDTPKNPSGRKPASQVKQEIAEAKALGDSIDKLAAGKFDQGELRKQAGPMVEIDAAKALIMADQKNKGVIDLEVRENLPSFWYAHYLPERLIEKYGLQAVVRVLRLYGKTFETVEKSTMAGNAIYIVREYAFVPEGEIDYKQLYKSERVAMIAHLTGNIVPRLRKIEGSISQLKKIINDMKMVKEVKYLARDFLPAYEQYKLPNLKQIEFKLKTLKQRSL